MSEMNRRKFMGIVGGGLAVIAAGPLVGGQKLAVRKKTKAAPAPVSSRLEWALATKHPGIYPWTECRWSEYRRFPVSRVDSRFNCSEMTLFMTHDGAMWECEETGEVYLTLLRNGVPIYSHSPNYLVCGDTLTLQPSATPQDKYQDGSSWVEL